jgi:hypothetical protein
MNENDIIQILRSLKRRVDTLEQRQYEVVNGVVYVGDTDGNVVIDGDNKRILINDGTNNRVLIGYGAGLF